MNDGYDPVALPAEGDHDGDTEYNDSRKSRKPASRSKWPAALNVLLDERTIIPVTATPIDGNTRLLTYALYPLIGVLIGLVLIIWVNIGRIMSMSLFLTSLIGLILIYAVQAGLPPAGVGQASDALFSGRRKDDQLRILTARALRPSALFAALIYAAAELTALYYLFIFSMFSIWRVLIAVLAVFVLARAVSSLLTLSLPPLEPEEDGDMKTLKAVQMILYIVIAVSAVLLILTGMWAAFVSVALVLLVAVLCHSIFKSRYRGITRKLSVFMTAAAELAGLLALLLPLGTFLW